MWKGFSWCSNIIESIIVCDHCFIVSSMKGVIAWAHRFQGCFLHSPLDSWPARHRNFVINYYALRPTEKWVNLKNKWTYFESRARLHLFQKHRKHSDGDSSRFEVSSLPFTYRSLSLSRSGRGSAKARIRRIDNLISTVLIISCTRATRRTNYKTQTLQWLGYLIPTKPSAMQP